MCWKSISGNKAWTLEKYRLPFPVVFRCRVSVDQGRIKSWNRVTQPTSNKTFFFCSHASHNLYFWSGFNGFLEFIASSLLIVASFCLPKTGWKIKTSNGRLHWPLPSSPCMWKGVVLFGQGGWSSSTLACISQNLASVPQLPNFLLSAPQEKPLHNASGKHTLILLDPAMKRWKYRPRLLAPPWTLDVRHGWGSALLALRSMNLELAAPAISEIWFVKESFFLRYIAIRGSFQSAFKHSRSRDQSWEDNWYPYYAVRHHSILDAPGF